MYPASLDFIKSVAELLENRAKTLMKTNPLVISNSKN